jgi:succinate dehydrogenase hydrophobic anchor subunit
VPVVLIPMLIIWGRHRRGSRAAWAGAGGCLAVVAAGIVPFAVMSPSGTWELAKYHLDRPLQVESLGSAYLLGLHAIAGIRVSIEDSFGSQGLDGSGPAIISVLSTVVLIGVLVAIAWTLWLGLHRARGPGDARLLVAASAATIAALLVGGKVLSPQFMVWLLPFGFVVAGRFGPAAAVLTASAMLVTLAYFPRQYWDLVALDTGPIALLVVRDLLLIAVLAACWPRPSIAGRPLGRTLGRGADPKRAERAVSARYLVD